jgi:ArsR family transcriptional regulator
MTHLLEDSDLNEATATRVAEMFSALSDPSRVRIISILYHGARHVGAIAACIGLSESAVSHQLRLLRQLRLVTARKSGQQVFYALADQHIADLFLQGLDHVQNG